MDLITDEDFRTDVYPIPVWAALDLLGKVRRLERKQDFKSENFAYFELCTLKDKRHCIRALHTFSKNTKMGLEVGVGRTGRAIFDEEDSLHLKSPFSKIHLHELSLHPVCS